jgi:uncharacterized membrane protein/predicted DsbA family dithiol-disulfide isomerase
MIPGLTLHGWSVPRVLSAVAGAGMMAGSAVTTGHYYAARYPAARAVPAPCDLVSWLSCDSAVLSAAGTVAGVPLGWFGLLLGAMVLLGALLPSLALERTNRALAVINGAAVLGLFGYSVFALQSLCLPCLVYGGSSMLSLALFVTWRDTQPGSSFLPAPAHAGVAAAVALTGAWSLGEYQSAVQQADDSVLSVRAVSSFYALPQVPWPSEISRYRSVSSTDDFEAAPIRIVEFADPQCIDCRVFHTQIRQLEREFPGAINVAYQFFPLEAACNDVVAKDKFVGSCDLSYMLAWAPDRFRDLHDEIYDNMRAAGDAAWRADFARRHGLAAALTDAGVRDRVHRLIRTGAEFEKTSEQYAHGIRSTPTLIINGRMIIGTLPLEQLRAIFRALIDEHENGGAAFMENWIDAGCVLDLDDGPPTPCGAK